MRSEIYNNITKDEQAEMKIPVVRFIGCMLTQDLCRERSLLHLCLYHITK